MNRRNFLSTVLAVAAVSAVGGLAKKSWAEVYAERGTLNLKDFGAVGDPILWGDGVHDDTEALQAMIDGRPYWHDNVFVPEREASLVSIPVGEYIVGGTIYIRNQVVNFDAKGATFIATGGGEHPVFQVDGSHYLNMGNIAIDMKRSPDRVALSLTDCFIDGPLPQPYRMRPMYLNAGPWLT